MATTQTDQKRQSVGNRVATPKVGSQGPSDLDSALEKAIGARIRLTTANPTTATLEGTLFTACRTTNLVAISTASDAPSQSSDFHLIPISRIQKFDVLSLASGTGPENGMPSISKVDLKSVKAREETAIRKLKEAEARRGKGVGKDAQAIFDSFARLYPARWHGTDMIINDSVIIRAPYGKENCSAPQSQQNALERIRGQLDRFAELKARATPQPAPASGPRKGG